MILFLNSLFNVLWMACFVCGRWIWNIWPSPPWGGGAKRLELVNMQMNLKRHIVKIICFALDRGGEEIKVTFLHVKVNTNQQRKHHVIWFKSLMLQGEVTWSSCVLIRLPFWRNYGDYGIWLGLFICLLIARPAELDGRGPTVCLRVNTHPENGLKSEKSFSSTWEFKSLIAKLKALQSLHQNEQCRHIRKQRWNDDENTTFTLSLILNYWTAGWLFTGEGSESLCVRPSLRPPSCWHFADMSITRSFGFLLSFNHLN